MADLEAATTNKEFQSAPPTEVRGDLLLRLLRQPQLLSFNPLPPPK